MSTFKEMLLEHKWKVAIAVIVIAAIGVKFFGGQSGPIASPEMKQEVSALVIKPQDKPITFNFSARTEGSKEVEIRSQVAGILQSQLFTDGKIVKAGDKLFTIDPRQFEIAVNSAESGLLKSQAELVQAEKDEGRLKLLIERRAISQREYDDAFAKLQMARANHISAQTKLDEAKLNLSYTVITAPISGSVSRALKNEGALINASETLLTKIIQLDPIYANFSISENDFVRLEQNISKGIIKMPEGTKLDVELIYGDNIKYSHTGHVSFSDSEIKKGTGVIEVRTSFPNPENNIIPGQFVKLKLTGAYRPSAIVIPRKAVIDAFKGSVVYVINELDKAIETEVSLGDNIGDNVQVMSGLKAGDKVIVDGAQKVQNEMNVTISKVLDNLEEEQGYIWPTEQDLQNTDEQNIDKV